ncbi:MAG: diguanylate cyclase, partial [Gammaproteobacteria bacterium]|nr:diguanylate cyclase [Gammaproteobacteria bacterium]
RQGGSIFHQRQQAWLFMLAEPTLQCLAERIADDLPEDLAVLNEVQMPASTSGSTPSSIEAADNINNLDNSIGCGKEQAIGAGATSTISLEGFSVEPSHQVSFSQHYRQQLLACF